MSSGNVVLRAKQRKERFRRYIELRSIYRNFIRARFLLKLPSPIFVPLEQDGACAGLRGSGEGIGPGLGMGGLAPGCACRVCVPEPPAPS